MPRCDKDSIRHMLEDEVYASTDFFGGMGTATTECMTIACDDQPSSSHLRQNVGAFGNDGHRSVVAVLD
jgi:hypothetical protein